MTPDGPDPGDSLRIREAAPSDADELARLTSQLGYPADGFVLGKRLGRILADPGNLVLVAAAPDGRLAGWIHGFHCQLLESDRRVEIGGLVVDIACRRRGIGQRLVAGVEDWARRIGAEDLAVRCRVERAESHLFYEAMGFRPIKTQKAFRKRIAGPAAA